MNKTFFIIIIFYLEMIILYIYSRRISKKNPNIECTENPELHYNAVI